MANLAHTYWSQNERGRAINSMSDALSKRSALLGPSHPDTKSSANTPQEWKESMAEGKKSDNSVLSTDQVYSKQQISVALVLLK
jgi:hypothetical protein